MIKGIGNGLFSLSLYPKPFAPSSRTRNPSPPLSQVLSLSLTSLSLSLPVWYIFILYYILLSERLYIYLSLFFSAAGDPPSVRPGDEPLRGKSSLPSEK